MSNTPRVNSSGVVWDGKKMSEYQSGSVSFITGAIVDGASFVAPCDAEIVAATVRVLASTASTLALVNIGGTDADSMLVDYPLTAVAAGSYDFLGATNWTTGGKTVTKGQEIVVSTEAATTAGTFAVNLVLAPR